MDIVVGADILWTLLLLGKRFYGYCCRSRDFMDIVVGAEILWILL